MLDNIYNLILLKLCPSGYNIYLGGKEIKKRRMKQQQNINSLPVLEVRVHQIMVDPHRLQYRWTHLLPFPHAQAAWIWPLPLALVSVLLVELDHSAKSLSFRLF